MHNTHGLTDLFKFIVLFVPIWWIWNGITFYNERYEMDNVRHRLLIFMSILPVAGIAWSVHDAFGKLGDVFAVSHIAARLLLIYMWMTACRADLEKKLSVHFSVGLFISASFFAASIWMGPRLPYVALDAGLNGRFAIAAV